eukprot:TRINITY_DN5735_c0_g1_i1.p1 TRINITY_DN5735_c0_g1~~TRINITY_DN5735_c0_g1_i1.p1  ORF type:complete len:189 (-),score=15.36 TRINITY_DN5735_c0_g1_i1:83-649(-)
MNTDANSQGSNVTTLDSHSQAVDSNSFIGNDLHPVQNFHEMSEVNPTLHEVPSQVHDVPDSHVVEQAHNPEVMASFMVAASIYFCFVDDKNDKIEIPNKLILAKPSPTVADFCSTIKALFLPGQEVVLTCSFVHRTSSGNNLASEYPESSMTFVPVNDRTNVVLVKLRYMEANLTKWNPQHIQSMFIR